MTADDLLATIGAPVGGFLMAMAIYLLGMALFREITGGSR